MLQLLSLYLNLDRVAIYYCVRQRVPNIYRFVAKLIAIIIWLVNDCKGCQIYYLNVNFFNELLDLFP